MRYQIQTSLFLSFLFVVFSTNAFAVPVHDVLTDVQDKVSLWQKDLEGVQEEVSTVTTEMSQLKTGIMGPITEGMAAYNDAKKAKEQVEGTINDAVSAGTGYMNQAKEKMGEAQALKDKGLSKYQDMGGVVDSTKYKIKGKTSKQPVKEDTRTTDNDGKVVDDGKMQKTLENMQTQKQVVNKTIVKEVVPNRQKFAADPVKYEPAVDIDDLPRGNGEKIQEAPAADSLDLLLQKDQKLKIEEKLQ